MTLYPSYFSTGQLPMCANWVFIFEKTLPDQGGRSKIDGLLCDGGATLTHEIGHQMVSCCCCLGGMFGLFGVVRAVGNAG